MTGDRIASIQTSAPDSVPHPTGLQHTGLQLRCGWGTLDSCGLSENFPRFLSFDHMVRILCGGRESQGYPPHTSHC